MSVSVAQGKAGTQVVVTVTGCLSRPGEPDQITWQASAQADRTSTSRVLAGVVRDGDVLHASFTVPAGEPAGQGIFDALCGRDGVRASASFTVL